MITKKVLKNSIRWDGTQWGQHDHQIRHYAFRCVKRYLLRELFKCYPPNNTTLKEQFNTLKFYRSMKNNPYFILIFSKLYFVFFLLYIDGVSYRIPRKCERNTRHKPLRHILSTILGLHKLKTM